MRTTRTFAEMISSERLERFWSKVDKNGPLPHPDSMAAGKGPCWLWTDAPDGKGYGHFLIGRQYAAHIASWLIAGRRFRKGRVLDHLCHNDDPSCPGGKCRHRLCVNPAHLESVSLGENIRRGRPSAPHLNAAKTECPSGHEYTPENTHIYRGHRYCRACDAARGRAKRARARQSD